MGKLTFEVKVHTWLEGESKSNPEDVLRRLAQHLFNNAVQRKRTLILENEILGITLTDEERNALLNIQSIINKIEKLKDSAALINTDCVKLVDDLNVILAKYVSEDAAE